MRILHLATSPDGGAGIAATRLVDAQCQIGMQATLLTRDNQRKTVRTLLKRTFGKGVTLWLRANVSKDFGVISPISISTISFKEIESFRPDILHIHNWYNFLSIHDIYQLSKRYPITFTLHDSRLATGGCHVTLGCKKFEKECKKCPASKSGFMIELSKKRLDNYIARFERYAVVSPSKWMLTEIGNSSLVNQAHVVEVIGNPVPNKNDLSEKSEVNQPVQMCFVSATLESQFKGLEMLKSSLQILSLKIPEFKAEVSLIGDTKVSHDSVYGGIKLKTIGSVDETKIKSYLENADIVLVPSQSDNYPSVITEAQFAGAMVVATRVGGIPEMIVDGVDGFLSENSAKDFAERINHAISHSEYFKIRKSAQESAKKRTQSSTIASSYLKVYQKLIKQ